MHEGVALGGEGFRIAQQGRIVAFRQARCVLPRQAQGALELVGALLLLHFQHGVVRRRIVAAQANFAPQLHAGGLLVKIAVVDAVEIEGADGVAVDAVVGILLHDLGEPVAQADKFRQREQEFLFFTQHLIHRFSPLCHKKS